MQMPRREQRFLLDLRVANVDAEDVRWPALRCEFRGTSSADRSAGDERSAKALGSVALLSHTYRERHQGRKNEDVTVYYLSEFKWEVKKCIIWEVDNENWAGLSLSLPDSCGKYYHPLYDLHLVNVRDTVRELDSARGDSPRFGGFDQADEHEVMLEAESE